MKIISCLKTGLTPLIVLFLLSCQPSVSDTSQQVASNTDTLSTSVPIANSDTPVYVFGYRFVISGDFDGDGKKERLIEHYASQLTGRETNKFSGKKIGYDSLVTLTMQKKPYSFALSDNTTIDTLRISAGDYTTVVDISKPGTY